MMLKKVLLVISVLTLSLTLISCNKETKTSNDGSKNSQVETSNTDKSESNIDTTEDKPVAETKENKLVRLYFYDIVNDNIVFYDDTVEVIDNALTTALVSALKSPININVTPIIPKDINLKSAKLDKENNLLTIDFPVDFVSKLNLGSGAESQTIQAIVNTMGYNYKVDNVIITLDSKPYSSGHILMSEGESFKVSLEDAIKL